MNVGVLMLSFDLHERTKTSHGYVDERYMFVTSSDARSY